MNASFVICGILVPAVLDDHREDEFNEGTQNGA
jgi:hypothetical protein